MKKPMIFSFAALLCAVTVSYSQSTTGSTDKGAGQNKQNQATPAASQGKGNPTAPPAVQGKKTSGTQSGNQSKSDQDAAQQTGEASPSPERQGSLANEVKSSTRPGGATKENANDVGKYSENEDSKSLLNSKEAIEKRNKNLTESDTTLRKGSGSAKKNMKNHTGKTGNYQNEATKPNQRKP